MIMKCLFSIISCFFLVITVTAQKTWDGGGGSNNWNDGNNWNPNGVPNASDAVTIGNGFNVVLNTNASIASLTIGGGVSGSLTIGNNNTDRTLSVSGNIIVSNGATLQTAGNGGNLLNIGGNLQNSGVFDLRIGGATANVVFNGSTNQTISGTGGTTDFNAININNTNAASIIDIASSNFSAATGFLTLTRGIIRMSGNYTFSNTFFNTANPVINSDEGIWLNNPNVTVTAQNGDTQLAGLIRISNGTYNIGIAADWWLTYNTGATLIIEGGAMNISGALIPGATGQTISYNQSGGTLTVCTAGNNFSVGSFELSAAGSSFTMSGGAIVFQRPSAAVSDWISNAATYNVTGGTIQFGNTATPASPIFQLTGTTPINDLFIHATNSPVFRFTTTLNVIRDVIINGTLDADAFDQTINVTRNWINNGSFNAGTGTVILNGNGAQAIQGSAATTFNNLTIDKSAGGVTLNQPVFVNGTATFTNGVVSSNNTNLITFNAGAAAVNASASSHVNGPVAKTGTAAFTFPVGNGTIYRPIAIGTPSTSSTFRASFVRTNPVIAVPPYSLGTGLTRVSSCEYWLLDRTAGTGNTNVTLSWGANSPCNTSAYVNSIADLRVARHNGGIWVNEGQSASSGTNTAGTVTSTVISSFSPFALGTTGTLNPLPAELSTLSAVKNAGVVALQFRNYAEKEVLQYEWMRSSNGRDFIQFQTAQPNLNNGSEAIYNTTDAAGAEATVFYRVKVILTDGQQLYSSVVKVTGSRQKSWNILPNPVTQSQLMIQFNQFESGTYDFSLMNSNGQKVLQSQLMVQGNFMTSLIRLPQGLIPGTYFVVITGKQERLTKTILIQ
jgi:hypothetical protein